MTAARRQRLSPQARRLQIIEATIDTVAALGYRAATYAKIAERSGLSSTRLISYHFAGREELMQATIVHVYGLLGEQIERSLERASGPAEELAAYIRAVCSFVDGHRSEMQALALIFISFRDDAGTSRSYDAENDQRAIGTVEAILRRGQQSGDFGDFDPFVLGSLVQRSVDGLPFLLQTRPDLDLAHYAEELVRTFAIATRRDRR